MTMTAESDVTRCLAGISAAELALMQAAASEFCERFAGGRDYCIWPPGQQHSIVQATAFSTVMPDHSAVDAELTAARRGAGRYQAFALGRDLRVQEPQVALRPWPPAADLPAGNLAGDLVELPVACGKQVAYYPSILICEAAHDRFYVFAVSRNCDIAYLTLHDVDRYDEARASWQKALVMLEEFDSAQAGEVRARLSHPAVGP